MFEFGKTDNKPCTGKRVGKFLSCLACALALILLIMPISSATAAPTANEIANQVTNNFKNYNTVQGTVQFQYWKENGKKDNTASMTAFVQADLKSKLFRVEIQKHSMFEGMIVVWNQAKKTAAVLYPVIDTVFTGSEAKVAGQLNIDLSVYDISSLMTIDVSSLASIKYIGTEKLNRIDHYVVQVTTKEFPNLPQKIWVDMETMMISRIVSYYGNGKVSAQVDITNFKSNISLTQAKLESMPKGMKTQPL